MQRRLLGVFLRERLRYDATYSLEATYAVDHGIPWEEYLERWGPQSRSVVIAVQMEKASRCSMCGSAEWEWLEDPQAYEAVQHQCKGCAAKDIFTDALPKDGRLPGSSVRLLPGATVRAMQEAPARRPLSPRERSAQGDDA